MTIRIEFGEAQRSSDAGADGIHWPDGRGVSSYRNTRAALLALDLAFRYDRRSNRAYFERLYKKKRRRRVVSGRSLSRLRQQISERFEFDPRKEHLADAAMQLAYENSFDPVVEYLDALSWDGIERLATWLIHYLGVEDTPLARAISVIVLVAAVRRARRPGCKFDEILVLIGDQGLGKSRFVRILARRRVWFSDQELLHLNAQQQQEALEGIWIFELSELGGLGRASVERVKAFASRSVDRARRAYGHFREDLQRRCIFIATTNDRQFLRDPTGNRRFWPVEITKVRLKELKRDVDQLWAEAAVLEAQGESIRLPRKFWKAAQKAQSKRMEDDPWIAILSELRGELHGNEWRVSYSDIFAKLGLPPQRQTAEDMKRIAWCMKQNGWERRDKPFKYRGTTSRGFSRADQLQDTS